MLNGKSLANAPLSTRKRVLFNHEAAKGEEHRLFEPIQGRLEIAEYWEGRTEKDIRSRLEDVMEEKWVFCIACLLSLRCAEMMFIIEERV
jgi:hypothetical protein